MKRLAGEVLSTRQRRMIAVQLEVTRLAREFNIALDRVQYRARSLDNGALERFAIAVPLAGGYTNLRKFIQSVESSDNFLVIERVALGTGKTADVVELNITLATYFIAPDADLERLGKKPRRSRESVLMAAPASRRQTLLLLVLGLAVAVWLWGTLEGRRAGVQGRSGAIRLREARSLAMGAVPVVHMDQLDRAVATYDPSGRDLFKYSTRPPSWNQVKQMRAAAAAAAKAQREAEERARLLAARAAEAGRGAARATALAPPAASAAAASGDHVQVPGLRGTPLGPDCRFRRERPDVRGQEG